jgi:hypothetical protein
LKIYLSWLGDTQKGIVVGIDYVEDLTEQLVIKAAPIVQERNYNLYPCSTFLLFATGFNLK